MTSYVNSPGMQKPILILPALIFIFSNCVGQTAFKNWEKLQLKGRIKTLTEKFCEPPLRIQFEQQESIIPEKTSIEVYQFNWRGDVVQCITTAPSQGLSWLEVFRYDDKNNLTEYFESDAGGEFYFKVFMRYDHHGNLIEKKECHQYGKMCDSLVYRYNKYNQLVEEAEYWQESKPEWKTVYRYDDKKNMVAKLVFNANWDGPDSVAYSFDNEGKLTEFKEYLYSDSVSHRRTTRSYDDNENMVEEIQYRTDGKISIHKKINYIYDKNGNWISRMEFRNENLYTTKERVIEYY